MERRQKSPNLREERPLVTSANRIHRRELIGVLALAGLFAALALLTNHQQLPWGDEVQFVEPAYNLAQGQGFHSFTWDVESGTQFFAGNVPAYPLLVSLWLRWFGINLYQAHVLNYLLGVLSVLLIWWRTARNGIVMGGGWRVGLVAGLLACESFSYATFNLRYDVLAIFLAALAYCFFNSKKSVAIPSLILIGIALPFAGLHLLPCAVLIGAVVAALRLPNWPRLAWLYLGGACGLAALVALFHAEGVLSTFLSSCREQGGQTLLEKLSNFRYYFEFDGTTALLLVSTALLLLAAFRRGRPANTCLLWVALASAVALPLILFVMRRFVMSYAWVIEIPLLILLFAYGSRLDSPGKSQWETRIALVLVALGCALGTPKLLAGKLLEYNTRDFRKVDRWVAAMVPANSQLACTYPAFLSAKSETSHVYSILYLASRPQAERNDVSLMIVQASQTTEVQALLGGQWEEIGEIKSKPLPKWLARFSNYEYDLQAYRRAEP